MSNEKECLGCGQKFKRSEAAVMCTVCGLWSHKTCSGVSSEFFKFLAEQHKATGRAYWACRACSNYAEGMNHRLREIQLKADEALKLAKESRDELGQLSRQVEKEKERVEKRIDKSEFNMLEEMNLREEKRKNVVIHGLVEAEGVDGWRRMEKDKEQLNNIFTVLDINLTVETDVEFCRRIGERGDRARPLIVGFFTEQAKSLLQRNCRYLAETDLSNLSITNDLTEKQRMMERELEQEAVRRNDELSEDDRAKNLVWRVVGKKGQRRLIKGPSQVRGQRGGGRATVRGGMSRGRAGSTMTTNLLPARGRGAGPWRPSQPAGGEKRKRNGSNETDQQRKRGTAGRGRPPLRRQAAAGTSQSRDEPDVTDSSSDLEELPTISQMRTGDDINIEAAMETSQQPGTSQHQPGTSQSQETRQEADEFPPSGIRMGEEY
jgi:hypothetical protein